MATYVSTHPGTMKQTRNLKELSIFFNDRIFRMEDFAFLNNPSSSQFQNLEDLIMTYIVKHQSFIILFDELKSKSKDVLYQIEQKFNENRQRNNNNVNNSC